MNTNQRRQSTGDSRKGGNLIEFALMLPWFVFLFVGAFDIGFYCYSLIASTNAARVAAIYTATSAATAADSATACTYVLDQLRALPNVGANVTSCSGSPVTVTAIATTGPDGEAASAVSLTYVTPRLIPIPGLFPGQLTISRTITMGVGA